LHYFPGIVILIEVILQEKEAFGQCPDVSDDRFAENGRGLWKKLSFNDVILLNEALSDNQLNFRVHLRNVSERQAIWIEPLGICACEGRYDKLYEVIEKVFSGERAKGSLYGWENGVYLKLNI